MRRLLTMLALCVLIPTASLASEPRVHIEEILAKFVSAFNAGDAATVASFYTEDAALLPPGGERLDGRAAIEAFWQGGIDSGMTIQELRPVEVDARRDLAGEVGVFTLTVPGETEPTQVTGKYIVIWKRSGHTWRLHRDIWNTD